MAYKGDTDKCPHGCGLTYGRLRTGRDVGISYGRRRMLRRPTQPGSYGDTVLKESNRSVGWLRCEERGLTSRSVPWMRGWAEIRCGRGLRVLFVGPFEDCHEYLDGIPVKCESNEEA